jgi:hypothetical protein
MGAAGGWLGDRGRGLAAWSLGGWTLGSEIVKP